MRVLIASVLLVISGCKSGEANRERPVEPARVVRTVKAEASVVADSLVVTGELAAEESASVGVKVPGRLELLRVDLGSRVKRGELIARIEQRDYKLRLQQAEAALRQARVRLGLAPDAERDVVEPESTGVVRQARALLDEAKANRDRSHALLQQGLLSQASYDSVEAAYKVALSRYQDAVEEVNNRLAVLAERRAQVEIAAQQLADTSLYAPFDGVVQERRAGLGEFLAAGAPVVTVVKIDPLRLRVEVPERSASRVRVGQKVAVSVEGDPTSYAGRISRISPVITPQSRVLVVEAEVANNDGKLRPGSFARAEITTSEQKQVVSVPASALVTFAGIEKVIVVKDGKAVEQGVSAGRKMGDRVQILSGLEPGSEVVVEPGNLQQGQAVTVDAKTR